MSSYEVKNLPASKIPLLQSNVSRNMRYFDYVPDYRSFLNRFYSSYRKKILIPAISAGLLGLTFAVTLFHLIKPRISDPWNISNSNHNSFIPEASFSSFTSTLDLIKPISLLNASAVFNTVQGALRSKDSQIHPIGVSFIPAYIPKGTLLYHGSGKAEIEEGLEWVAFDREYSYLFLSLTVGPHFRLGRGATSKDNESDDSGNGGRSDEKLDGPPKGPRVPSKLPPKLPKQSRVSLFTLEVLKPLDKMILLDGSSAAKTSSGEMDQQMILARSEDGLISERTAADRICQWGSSFGLDGYIRIEVGFEAVLCNMKSDKVKIVNNVTLSLVNEDLGLDLKEIGNDTDITDLLHDISAMRGYDQVKQGNIHDKREGRALLDFKGLQTPLNKTFISHDTYFRRMLNISNELKDEMILNLETFFKSHGSEPSSGTDWQLVTTEIVDKFAPVLILLNNTLASKSYDQEIEVWNTVKNLTLFSSNFVTSFTDFSIEDESERAINAKAKAIIAYAHPLQTIQTESEVLILSSIYKITEAIVDLIFQSYNIGRDALHFKYIDRKKLTTTDTVTRIENLQTQFTELLSSLQWASFYHCSLKCNWDEVCYTPSWGPSPLGWSSSLGTYIDSEGIPRISQEEQCLSYKTIKNKSNW